MEERVTPRIRNSSQCTLIAPIIWWIIEVAVRRKTRTWVQISSVIAGSYKSDVISIIVPNIFEVFCEVKYHIARITRLSTNLFEYVSFVEPCSFCLVQHEVHLTEGASKKLRIQTVAVTSTSVMIFRQTSISTKYVRMDDCTVR